jgi:AcrR family transcriptional regulator
LFKQTFEFRLSQIGVRVNPFGGSNRFNSHMLQRSRAKRKQPAGAPPAQGRSGGGAGAKRRPSLGRPATIDPNGDTRARILQAAEMLFAEHGFDAVSMRDITTLAKVNLASVNYHFGSKLALLAEVVGTRANFLVDERLRLLEGLRRDRQGRPKLEAVIEGFLRPSLEMSRQPGGANHMRLRARLAVERVGGNKAQFEQIFDASNEKVVDALEQALPDYPRAEIYWGFHCLLGIQNYTMANSGRIQHLSHGTCDPTDVEATLARIVPFIAHGFRALLRKR